MGLGEVLREFGVKISLNFDKKKMEEIQDGVEKLGSKMRRFSFEVAGAAAAIFEFANLSSSNARDLQQNASLLGLNVEKLQEMEYAAKVAAGVNREELVGSLQAVSETMDKARHGDVMASESLLRLAQSGVGVDKMLGMLKDRTVTADQVMVALSASFKNIKDPLAAARLATDAFGSAGARLLPLLRQGPEGFAKLSKEARAMGIVMDKGVIDRAAEMDRQFTKIWFVLKNTAYTIGYELLKYLKPLVIQFEHFMVANKKLIAIDIAKALKVIAQGLMVVFKVGTQLAPILGKIIDLFGGVETATKLLVGAFLGFKAAGFISSLSAIAAAAGIPLIPIVALGVALHDIWTVLSGGSLKDTWIGKLIDGVQSLLQSLGLVKDLMSWTDKLDKAGAPMLDKVHSFISELGNAFGPTEAAYGSVTPSLASAGGAPMQQEFNLNTTNNIGIPPGTSATQAAGMVSKASVDSHSQMMLKAKNDALRGRQY